MAAGPGGFDEVATDLRKPVGATEPEPGFVLVGLEGGASGLRFELDASRPSRVLIGQSPACDVRLADREVSRRHAAVDLTRGELKVTDLGSTNGTLVDGVRVVEAYLRPGSVLRMGSAAFRVEGCALQSPALSNETSFGAVIGASVEMRRLYPLCSRLASSTVPAVIEGETGTGKEVLAESLHDRGPRAAGPFVVFDCTAVPANLVESELFGHERGAFTGAVSQRKGLFEQAHGGTLLIDEIGDLDVTLQPKLLRALERSEIRRIGADRPLKVDVRILAATRRDLDREVQRGYFRDDLFHRLAVGRIELPPLRLRRGDVRVLAHHFGRAFGASESALPHELLTRWEEAPWPGNVRELRNAVARRVALGELASSDPKLSDFQGADGAGPADFLEQVLQHPLKLTAARQIVVDEFERRYVERVLEHHGGNVAKAAVAAGVARRYFQILRARRATR